jgi:hypothetical protein
LDRRVELPGYLLAMRKRLESRFDAAAKIAMATSAPMGGRTIAQFMSGHDARRSRSARGAARVRVDRGDRGARCGGGARRAGGDPRRPRGRALAKLAAWLRKLVDATDAPQDEVVRALARCGDVQDWAIFVGGLSSADKSTVAPAPRRSRRSTEARLAGALPRGARRGAATGQRDRDELLKLVEHWGGEKLAPDADWNAALAAQERSFKLRFPDYSLDAGSVGEGPRWDFERTLAFPRAQRGA